MVLIRPENEKLWQRLLVACLKAVDRYQAPVSVAEFVDALVEQHDLRFYHPHKEGHVCDTWDYDNNTGCHCPAPTMEEVVKQEAEKLARKWQEDREKELAGPSRLHDFAEANAQLNREKAEWLGDQKTYAQLLLLLKPHCGETGVTEGAIETLKRKVEESLANHDMNKRLSERLLATERKLVEASDELEAYKGERQELVAMLTHNLKRNSLSRGHRTALKKILYWLKKRD